MKSVKEMIEAVANGVDPKVVINEAKAQAPKSKKLDRKTKMKSIDLFKKKGLDGNGRFSSVGSGISAAWDALSQLGINPDTATGDVFTGASGSRNLRIEWTNTSGDPFMPGASIPNSVLVVSWHKLGDNKFEVHCYLS